MVTRLKPQRVKSSNSPQVGQNLGYEDSNNFKWQDTGSGVGDMKYSDFQWETLTGNAITIEDISNNITPSSNFTVSAGTVKPGIEYVLRVNTGNSAYTMTLGTGITNPNGYSTDLQPNTVNQFNFIATSNNQLELEGNAGGMTILSYGNSTWSDFISAYNKNAIVYCRASSNSNPATGSQTRLAFMAYVNNASNPTEVEFQYYRSRSSHSTAANVLDEVYVYKLVPASGGTWTVTQRDTAAKPIAGTGIGLTYNASGMTISANTTVLATKTDLNSKQDTISDLAAIRTGAGLGTTALQPGDNVSDLNNDSGYITSSYHDSTKQDKLVSGTNIKTINGNGLLGGGNISIGEAHIMTQSEFDNVGSPKGIYFIYDYLYPTLYITITPNTYQAQVGDTIRFDITRGSNEAIGASTMTSSDGLNSWSSASFDGFTPYITGLTYTIKSEDVTAGKYVLTLIATETNNPSNTIEVSCVIQVNA